MFEKATLFSAIFIFIAFGIIGLKYYEFIESKNQVTKTSAIDRLILTDRAFRTT